MLRLHIHYQVPTTITKTQDVELDEILTAVKQPAFYKRKITYVWRWVWNW